MRRKITNDTWEQVETAYASGIGLREIARNMNIPEGTVLAHAKREGWTKGIESAKALAKREDSSRAITPTLITHSSGIMSRIAHRLPDATLSPK